MNKPSLNYTLAYIVVWNIGIHSSGDEYVQYTTLCIKNRMTRLRHDPESISPPKIKELHALGHVNLDVHCQIRSHQ